LLSPAHRKATAAAAPRKRAMTPGAVRGRVLGWLRAALLDGFAWAFTKPILRLSTGAWPAPEDVVAFRAAFRRFTPLPPLLRALANVPSGRHQLTRAMLASWLLADESYRGELRRQLRPQDAAPGDCLRIWTGPKVTFLHIEKTAGMAVTQVLTEQFHPLQLDADLRRAFPPHVLTPLPPFLLPHVRRCSLVWGHYDVPSIRRLGDDRFVMTFLREPRARILSLYSYWRGQAALGLGWDGKNQAILMAQRLSLLDFLNSDDPLIVDYIDNGYVRRLTGRYASFQEQDPLVEDPAGSLDAALRSLEAFDFVGLTEDTQGSMQRLGRMLGFTPPARMPKVNVTQRDGAAQPNADIDAALNRLTALDREVYTAAFMKYHALEA
jgi:hypothetical protein